MNPAKRKQLYRIELLKKKEEAVKEEIKAVEPVVVPEPVVEAAVETLPEVASELQPEVIVAEEVAMAPATTGKKKKTV